MLEKAIATLALCIIVKPAASRVRLLVRPGQRREVFSAHASFHCLFKDLASCNLMTYLLRAA